MRRRHRRTLEAIFAHPTRADIRWAEIESLLLACGATLVEGGGSRIIVSIGGCDSAFHRPHPRPDTDKGAVVAMRKFLTGVGITPDTI